MGGAAQCKRLSEGFLLGGGGDALELYTDDVFSKAVVLKLYRTGTFYNDSMSGTQQK